MARDFTNYDRHVTRNRRSISMACKWAVGLGEKTIKWDARDRCSTTVGLQHLFIYRKVASHCYRTFQRGRRPGKPVQDNAVRNRCKFLFQSRQHSVCGSNGMDTQNLPFRCGRTLFENVCEDLLLKLERLVISRSGV